MLVGMELVAGMGWVGKGTVEVGVWYNTGVSLLIAIGPSWLLVRHGCWRRSQWAWWLIWSKMELGHCNRTAFKNPCAVLLSSYFGQQYFLCPAIFLVSTPP